MSSATQAVLDQHREAVIDMERRCASCRALWPCDAHRMASLAHTSTPVPTGEALAVDDADIWLACWCRDPWRLGWLHRIEQPCIPLDRTTDIGGTP